MDCGTNDKANMNGDSTSHRPHAISRLSAVYVLAYAPWHCLGIFRCAAEVATGCPRTAPPWVLIGALQRVPHPIRSVGGRAMGELNAVRNVLPERHTDS
jgi:hypothetical protein